MITAALIYISYAYTLSNAKRATKAVALLCSGGIESQSQMIESNPAILEAQDT